MKDWQIALVWAGAFALLVIVVVTPILVLQPWKRPQHAAVRHGASRTPNPDAAGALSAVQPSPKCPAGFGLMQSTFFPTNACLRVGAGMDAAPVPHTATHSNFREAWLGCRKDKRCHCLKGTTTLHEWHMCGRPHAGGGSDDTVLAAPAKS